MTVEPNPACQGLRARKKLATREALSRAAIGLALERGLDNVRVDDIAAAAGVSPRTYNNYFSSREAAICALVVERAERVAAALRARPASESLTEAILNAMTGRLTGPAGPDKRMVRLITSSPALRGEYLKHVTAIERPLAEAIAARLGMNSGDNEKDLLPRVLAAGVYSAARVVTEQWLREDCDATYADLLREALEFIVPSAKRHAA